MYGIDNSFLVGNRQIPNINDPKGLNIDYYIEEGGYLFLSHLLGVKLYNELKQNLDEELNLKYDAAQKWKELFYGKEYDNKVFEGLIQEGVTFNKSVISDYIYWFWLHSTKTNQSGIGTVVLEGKNATRVSPENKLREVWNSIVEIVGGGNNGLDIRRKVSVINGIEFVDYAPYSSDNNRVSIIEFLMDHKKDYPNPSIAAPLGYSYTIQNEFGI